MEKKNGVTVTNVHTSVSPCLTSPYEKLHNSSLPSQLANSTNSSSCSSHSDTREDSVTPIQINQYSDREGTLKHQSSTPVPVTGKSASADSSPAIKRVTSISLYVKSKSKSPSSNNQAALLKQVVDNDDEMETQSAPNLLSAINDHDSLTAIDDYDDDRNVESITPTAEAAAAARVANDLLFNDNSSHSDSSSDSEVSSATSETDLKEQHSQQQIMRRPSQVTSVKHSISDHCLLDHATSPNDPARKRHSDILVETANDSVLYTTGSAPVVSKPHISTSDFNLSSNDEYVDLGDSTDTLDELYEKQMEPDIRNDGVIRYQQRNSHSGGRPRSADISQMAAEAKMRRVQIASSQSSALRKVYSSSNIDDFHTSQSMIAFRSHNKLHPKLNEEMYSLAENETKISHSYPGDSASFCRTGLGGRVNVFSRIGKAKKSHPVSRNNSDVTGLKKQTSHVSVKRSASTASDSSYIQSDGLSRDSKDCPSSQDSSTLSLRSGSGAPLLPPSPLISNITPVELTAPSYHNRRSGTLSPSIPVLAAEDEEPVENVMSQPSIVGIMQSRKPMVHCDPEIESSLDRAVAWPQPLIEGSSATQKGHHKKGDNKTNLKRAQTMMAAESENSHKKFWNFRHKKDKEKKKKYPATVKGTKVSSTYPRPSSASSSYAPAVINSQEEANQSIESDMSNVFPVKRVSHRQSSSRIEGRPVHFSPTVSPTERLVTADEEQEQKGNGISQPKANISTSSSSLNTSKLDLIENSRKSRSSSELYETEKEGHSIIVHTNVEVEEDRLQEDESVTKAFSAYPELYPDHHDKAVWSDNVPPKVLSKLNKVEKDRQAVIYELIQTENHILVAIQILLIVFKKSFQEELKLAEEILEQMFPHLEPLLMLTQEFYRKLKQRQEEARNHVVECIGDVLVDHFTGDKGDEVARVYGAFCSRQLRALDIYREQNKVKRFQKLATSFANTQVCQRRNYPEFITLLAQRITKYPHLLARLSKKTDPKHRDAKDLELALTHSVKVCLTCRLFFSFGCVYLGIVF